MDLDLFNSMRPALNLRTATMTRQIGWNLDSTAARSLISRTRHFQLRASASVVAGSLRGANLAGGLAA
jgi:hypothetical protein